LQSSHDASAERLADAGGRAARLCAALRRRLPGCPRHPQRRFLNTGGIITSHGHQIAVRLNRRTYSPILRQATLP
jgi:hypothetical protein